MNKQLLRKEWKRFVESKINPQVLSHPTFPTAMSVEVGLQKFHECWLKMAKHMKQDIWCWYGYGVQPKREDQSIHFHVLTEFEHNKASECDPERLAWWVETFWQLEINGNIKAEVYDETKWGSAYALFKHEPEDRIYCSRARKACDRRSACVYERDTTKWRKRHDASVIIV